VRFQSFARLLNRERHYWSGAKVTPIKLIDLTEMVIYSLGEADAPPVKTRSRGCSGSRIDNHGTMWTPSQLGIALYSSIDGTDPMIPQRGEMPGRGSV
jgi:hypothetical protein